MAKTTEQAMTTGVARVLAQDVFWICPFLSMAGLQVERWLLCLRVQATLLH